MTHFSPNAINPLHQDKIYEGGHRSLELSPRLKVSRRPTAAQPPPGQNSAASRSLAPAGATGLPPEIEFDQCHQNDSCFVYII